jgi:hypothetical protein
VNELTVFKIDEMTVLTATAALAKYTPLPSVISMLYMVVSKSILVEVDFFFFIKPLPKLYKLLPKHTAFWV